MYRSSQIRNSKQSLILRAKAELELRRRKREQRQSSPVRSRDVIARVAPRYQEYRHCAVLADILQRVANGEIKRLLVFTPPRHGKSETISRLFTALTRCRTTGA